MKSLFSILFFIIVSLSLVSCVNNDKKTDTGDGKLSIVATIFPQYDWIKQILGENVSDVNLTLLFNSGVDLHSYQPTVEEIIKISNCDIFVYVGGESDGWVKDVLKNAVNKNMKVINLMEVLGDSVKEEETVEGMQTDEHHHHHEHAKEDKEHAHKHEHEHDKDRDHNHDEEETEYDEHVWLSLKNAVIFVQKIADTLGEIDKENADTYIMNANSYIKELSSLDKAYSNNVNSASEKTVVFADRFPFRYLTDDYGLKYYAAFSGCSAESEASFETIIFLANKIDELGLNTVLTIEGKEHKIAETVIKNTKSKNQKIAVMDSMQSTTLKDVETGTTYLSVMEQNLKTLSEVLK